MLDTWNLNMERALPDILRDERSLGHNADGGGDNCIQYNISYKLSSQFHIDVDNVQN